MTILHQNLTLYRISVCQTRAMIRNYGIQDTFHLYLAVKVLDEHEIERKNETNTR